MALALEGPGRINTDVAAPPLSLALVHVCKEPRPQPIISTSTTPTERSNPSQLTDAFGLVDKLIPRLAGTLGTLGRRKAVVRTRPILAFGSTCKNVSHRESFGNDFTISIRKKGRG